MGGCALDIDVVHDGLQIRVDKTAATGSAGALLESGLLLPPRFVHQLFAAGRVTTSGARMIADDRLKAGQRLWLHGGVEETDETISALPGGDAPLDVLYEDAHVLVVNKPADVLVHPGTPSDQDTMAHRVVRYFSGMGLRRRPRHVHRLDKGTTGALLYAKHEYAARSFDHLLGERRIHRHYLALVSGRPPQQADTIRLPIGRDRHVSGRYRVSKTGKLAITHYRVLASRTVRNSVASLLECRLETGRTHQIRVHLAALGCPVVGDEMYGGGRGIGDVEWTVGQALHAWKLNFRQPYDDCEVAVQAPLPPLFAGTLQHVDLESALRGQMPQP